MENKLLGKIVAGCFLVISSYAQASVPSVPSLSGPSTSDTGNYTISWSSSTDATRYVLKGEGDTTLHNSSATSLSRSEPDGTYYYKVKACANKWASSCSNYSPQLKVIVKKALPTPGVVSSFTVSKSQVTDGDSEVVTFNWAKPSGYSNTVKYNFYITKPGERRWKYRTLISSTSLGRTMALVGAHKFEVEACNTDGVCGSSRSLFVTVKAPLAVPGIVSSFTVSKTQVTDGNNEVVTFNWAKPSGYVGTVKYNFYITKPGYSRWKYKTLITSTSLGRTMALLGTHKFEIEACNTEGDCGLPTSLYVKVIEPEPTVPSVVNSFRAEMNGGEINKAYEGDTFTLKWSKSSNYPEDVVYNIWSQKPGENLWKWVTSLDATFKERFSINIVGIHHFYIEACTLGGLCGERSPALDIEVIATPSIKTFFAKVNGVVSNEVQISNDLELIWDKPSLYSGEFAYNIWLKKPGNVEPWKWRTISQGTSTVRGNGSDVLGAHEFYIEPCRADNENYCGQRTLLNVDVIEQLASPELTAPDHSNDGNFYLYISSEVEGATSYQIKENGKDPVALNSTDDSLLLTQNKVSGNYTYSAAACNASGCSGFGSQKTVKAGIGAIRIWSQHVESNVDDIQNGTTNTDESYGGTVDFENAVSFIATGKTNSSCDYEANGSKCAKAIIYKDSSEKSIDRKINISFDISNLTYDWDSYSDGSETCTTSDGVLFTKRLTWILFQDWYRIYKHDANGNSPISTVQIVRKGDGLWLQHIQRAFLYEVEGNYSESFPAPNEDWSPCDKWYNEKVVGEVQLGYQASDGTTALFQNSTYIQIEINEESTSPREFNIFGEYKTNVGENEGMKVSVNNDLISTNRYQDDNGLIKFLWNYPIKTISEKKEHNYSFGIYHTYGRGDNLEVKISNLSFESNMIN